MQYAIETFSLTKIFSGWWRKNKVVAVDGLDLKVRTNEVFGLLGPNGSGKTTTLKMLLGLLHPTKGRALMLEGDARNPKVSARIGFLPEESYLYRYLTARETLNFYGQLFKLPAKVRDLRIEALLDMVGLKAVANRPVGTFSKGMARRIGLAQALINDPDLLILDEPTTGLDPIGTKQIKDLIIELAKRGKTVLLCNHLLADVEDVCDRIAILYGGKIQAQGEVSDLLRRTDKTEITTGLISDGARKKIEHILADERAEYQISAPMTRLETFFIDIIAAAQQQALPTSGAQGRQHISDFLSAQPVEKTRPADILDKLVAAPVSRERPPVTETRRVEPAPVTMPDEDLLSELTKKEDSPPVRPVVTEPTPQIQSPPQPDKSVLDELMDKPSTQDDDKKPGESKNA
jgi:ABC-2 type transport system ATP-binding protein